MAHYNYDITIMGTEGGELVACGRYRLKGHDKDRAIAKAVRLFRRDFHDRSTDKITITTRAA